MSSNFADLFEQTADRVPHRAAVVHGDRTATFAELDVRANRIAHTLAARGVGLGTHVGYLMHNSIETVETILACFKLGAVLVNVGYWHGWAQIRHLCDHADLEILVHHRCYEPAVAEARQSLPNLRHTIAVADEFTERRQAPSAASAETDLRAGLPFRPLSARGGEDLMLVYTLGTTGPPKAIMWQHQDLARVLAGSMDFHLDRLGARRLRGSHQGAGHPEWLVLVPLGDAAGVMPTLTALLCGHTVVLTSRFDPEEIWRIVAEKRPQVLVSAGDAMARPLLDAYRRRPTDATSLTTIASCAAPLSQSVKNELLEQFPWTDVFESIGSSETGLRGAGVARKDDDLARRSRFHLAPGTVVVDADGAPTETGAEGYLAATRNLPLGYYKDQRGTDSLLRATARESLAISQDVARVESDSTITFIGRRDTSIEIAGVTVFVEEIENVLKSFDTIGDAMAIALPHPGRGSQIAALVCSTDGTTLSSAALKRHLCRHLAWSKVPRLIWSAPTLPRSPSGKPDYRRVQSYIAERVPNHVLAPRGPA
ncbi:AMP-binding protein [Nocardia noduli]|uniref:AMP-binding protein n=1 Tax=Nocardia noduli TaxID=2815722 RepID=UPI001C21807C|nr:AMP-binding protein [Nocardia noduli]